MIVFINSHKLKGLIFLKCMVIILIFISCKSISNDTKLPSDNNQDVSLSEQKTDTASPDVKNNDSKPTRSGGYFIPDDSVRQAVPNTIFNLSFKNQSEQIYFPNGKVIDAMEYADLLEDYPASALRYDTLEDGAIGSRIRGVYIDFKKVPEELKRKLLSGVKLYNNAKIEDITRGTYYGQLAWNATEIGFPFIQENLVLFQEQRAVGQIGMLYTFDSLAQLLHVFDCNEYGLYSSQLTLDAKYLCIYSGYYSYGEEIIPERYRIYNFHSGKMIWETTNLPDEFGPPIANISNFHTYGYVFYPERRKVYHLSTAKVVPMKKFTREGLILMNGTFLDFERDWEILTFDEFNARNNVIN